jgi:GMP synthase-like glutamine amidotransferase
VQPQLQHEFGDYQDMFINTIIKANSGIKNLKLSFYDVQKGQYPIDINECDVYMSTGSQYSVYDNEEWIILLIKFIQSLYIAKKPFVGICFGHQLIAQALEGLVENSDKGWGVGVTNSKVIKKYPWMKHDLNSVNLVVSHQDQIIKLPKNAAVLMGNQFCPYYMIQIDEHFLGIQGHPEFSRDYSKALMLSRKDRIPKSTLDKGIKSLNETPDDLVVMQWILWFLKRAIINY